MKILATVLYAMKRHWISHNFAQQKNGFTLVEVLVALVVSSIMIAIILDGFVTAKTRQNQVNQKTEALLLSHQKIGLLRKNQGPAAEVRGVEGDLSWNLKERNFAASSRGNHVLIEAEIIIATPHNKNLLNRKIRYLRRVNR